MQSLTLGFLIGGMVIAALGSQLQIPDAIACYQKAIRCNPNYAPAYQNLGVVQLKVGNVQASLTAFQNAILLYEQQNPEEANRLRQGLREMGLMKS